MNNMIYRLLHVYVLHVYMFILYVLEAEWKELSEISWSCPLHWN